MVARPLPALELGQKSDPGRDPDKQVNEDSCGHRETRFGHLSVVCDGMGGHSGGAEASSLALQTILDHFDWAVDGAAPAEVLREALREANRRVYRMQSAEPGARPGSTVVALLVHRDGAEVAHVGDSRVYMLHEGQVFQVTKDHSMVQELVDRGFLTPAQAAVHPSANQITRALGMGDDVDVDVRARPLPYVTGDAFVLCSDGLSDLVEPHEILQVVGSAPAQQAAGQLVDLANARGGHDNITVQVVRTRESANAHAAQVSPTLALTLSDEIPQAERTTQPGIPVVPRALTLPLTQDDPELSAAPVAGGADRPRRTDPGLPAGTPPQGIAAPPSGGLDRPPLAAHIPAAPPASRPSQRPHRGPSVAVIVGVGLGVLGLLAAAVAIALHVSERTGKRHAPPDDSVAPMFSPNDATAD